MYICTYMARLPSQVHWIRTLKQLLKHPFSSSQMVLRNVAVVDKWLKSARMS
jgi:hypothetical protein